MGINIVLIEPEIPTNTGNIGRLSLASGSKLHLVKPFGFEIDDKRVKRAGLDYWKHLSPATYESLDEFMECHKGKKMAYFSSHAKQDYWKLDFEEDIFLIFGKESVGLPKELIENNINTCYKIPMFSEKVRSLNLANAVGIVVYDGIRKMSISNLETQHR